MDLSPPFQRRGGIWTEREQAYLIDSMINGFDVPKLYLADLTLLSTASLNSSKKRYAVIDGRQRFEAIFSFADGRIALNRDFIWEAKPEAPLRGLRYADLLDDYPEAARRFREYELDVMLVTTDDEAKINELFVRLNSSKSLTGAEVRNAMGGTVPILIRELARHEFFTRRVKFPTQRGQDLNAAAKLLLVEFSGRFVDTKKAQLDRFVEAHDLRSSKWTEALVGALLLSSEADMDTLGRAAQRVARGLDILAGVFRDRDPLLTSQGPITVYYWMLRDASPHVATLFRHFIAEFERRRRLNRQRGRRGAPTDADLTEYNELSRSTNDAGSLEGRYRILSRQFQDFLERAEYQSPLDLDLRV